MSETFCKMLIASFEQRPDKVAMRVVGDDNEVYTFAEMLSKIRSVAYRLGQENVAFGDRVALIGENHPSWAIAYLGAIYHGAVCVPLDPHGEIETITNFLENSEAKVVFLSPDQTERFSQIEEKLGRHIPAIVWEIDSPQSHGDAENQDETSSASQRLGVSNGFHSFSDWANTDFPESFANEVPRAEGDDIALLMYTSGTTGTPKGVPLTHGNIVGELSGVNDVLKLSDKERILSLLPLFHAYLQIVNLWVATTFGPQVGYLKELTPAELSESMKIFKPTILTTVPRLWYLFHKKIFDAVAAKPKPVQMLFRSMLKLNGISRDTLGVNLGNKLFGQVHESFGGQLRIAISAGSRFDDAVAADFHRLGFTIIQGYGLTETSGAATATYEDDNRVGSVGKPMKGAEIKILDPDKDGVGEVLIRGTMVFDGYFRNPTATAEAFTEDGWFRSGDLGRIDKDGFLYIVGRGKDVIVLPSGKNVHPEDLEVHYLKCPLVAELAIIGVADESEAFAGAEKLAAVIVPDFSYLKQAKIANSKEAIRHELDSLGRELPEYQRVRDYIIRSEPLPRTATNKIKRFQLKNEVETGEIAAEAKEAKTWELTASDTAMLETNAGRSVVEAIKQNAKDLEIVHPAMNLEIDLGLDSLARAETFAALEQAFSTEFVGDEAAQVLTVANVIELVNRHGGETTEAVSVDLNWGKIVREADDDFPEVQGILKDRPVFSIFAFAVYKCFHLFFRVFTRLEVYGLNNLKELSKLNKLGKLENPFLICPNHQSFLDPFVICSTYPFALFKNIFHVGASEFFNNAFMRFVAKMLNVVPVNPDTELMRAMKAGAIGLKHGKILNIYPEGERAFDGELHNFKKGAAILATELDIPIVPIAIDGLYKVWPRKSWRIRPAKVKMTIGTPFYAKDVIGVHGLKMSDDDKYSAVTSYLKQTIANAVNDMRK
ncbi:MAG: AMP-binding protein [Chloracidobacterium sp.]|nr:AMP-binding protein [Chloracidobacterium sp.]